MLYTCHEKEFKCNLTEVELGPSDTLHRYLAVKELQGICPPIMTLQSLGLLCCLGFRIALNIAKMLTLTGSEQVYIHCKKLWIPTEK